MPEELVPAGIPPEFGPLAKDVVGHGSAMLMVGADGTVRWASGTLRIRAGGESRAFGESVQTVASLRGPLVLRGRLTLSREEGALAVQDAGPAYFRPQEVLYSNWTDFRGRGHAAQHRELDELRQYLDAAAAEGAEQGSTLPLAASLTEGQGDAPKPGMEAAAR